MKDDVINFIDISKYAGERSTWFKRGEAIVLLSLKMAVC